MKKKVKVKKVIDGDTFEGPRKQFYRLSNVNAPEKGARKFKDAKDALKSMIEDETVLVEEEGQSYGRKVVRVKTPGVKSTVNDRMRRRGYK